MGYLYTMNKKKSFEELQKMPNITKDQFLASELKDISHVYLGKRNCCRCGCGGEYTATSFMDDPRSDVNDALVGKRLKKAIKLVQEAKTFGEGNKNTDADVVFGTTYVDVKTGRNRTLTFYFDELKGK